MRSRLNYISQNVHIFHVFYVYFLQKICYNETQTVLPEFH